MKTFCTHKEVATSEHKNHLLLTKCKELLQEYSTGHEQHKEMIRRFDELISAKVNVLSFIEYKGEAQ